METYRLFQVKPCPPRPPGLSPSRSRPRFAQVQGKPQLWQRTFPFLPSPGSFSTCFCSPGTAHCWNGDIPPAGSGRCPTSAFSQDAALKLFTNAKTREDCSPELIMLGMPGPESEHSPCAEKSKELVASPGCRVLRGTRSHPENTLGIKEDGTGFWSPLCWLQARSS